MTAKKKAAGTVPEYTAKQIPVLKGLGSNDEFAAIFVDHVKDAARDAGIVIKQKPE